MLQPRIKWCDEAVLQLVECTEAAVRAARKPLATMPWAAHKAGSQLLSAASSQQLSRQWTQRAEAAKQAAQPTPLQRRILAVLAAMAAKEPGQAGA